MTPLEFFLVLGLLILALAVVLLLFLTLGQRNLLRVIGERTLGLDPGVPDQIRTTKDGVDRLVSILVGSHSKGAAGENIVGQLLSVFPPDWLELGRKFNNKPVEFSLRLPNGLYLPIDSKIFSTNELAELEQDQDGRMAKKVREVLLRKAAEVEKYLDPQTTYSFCLAVVPDAVALRFSDVGYETWKRHVVFVGYSALVPYLLLIVQTVLTTSRNIDLEKLKAGLGKMVSDLEVMEAECHSRLSRAIVELTNSKTELLSRISSTRTLLAMIGRI